MRIDILGTEYSVEIVKEKDDPKLKSVNGYTELYSKKIIVENVEPDNNTVERLDLHRQKVLRHEIVHAFLFESGLDANSDWARNEEIVDWIALQFPKLLNAMRKAGGLDA